MKEFPLTIKSNAFFGDWTENEHGLYTTNLGAQIYLKTLGTTRIVLKMPNTVLNEETGPSVIAYKIDDNKWVSKDLSDKDIEIKLNGTKHLIRVITKGLTSNRGDYWNGNQAFILNGIEYDGEIFGAVPNRKIVYFIGDSITNGQNMNADSNKPDAHYPELSYGIQIGDQLDLNSLLIAYGGTGITNHSRVPQPNGDDFIWYMKKDVKRPLHLENPAELVVVNIGTNDSNADEHEFEFSLKTFNRELHKRFHQAKFVYITPFNQIFANVFKKIVPTFENSTLIDTKNWGISLSDDVHPDFNGEKTIIENLKPIIKTKLNA